MIILSNKREMYDVTNEDSTMRITGSFTHTSDGRVIQFNGNISDLQGVMQGSFTYDELLGDLVSKSINSAPATLIAQISTFIDATVVAIKADINK